MLILNSVKYNKVENILVYQFSNLPVENRSMIEKTLPSLLRNINENIFFTGFDQVNRLNIYVMDTTHLTMLINHADHKKFFLTLITEKNYLEVMTAYKMQTDNVKKVKKDDSDWDDHDEEEKDDANDWGVSTKELSAIKELSALSPLDEIVSGKSQYDKSRTVTLFDHRHDSAALKDFRKKLIKEVRNEDVEISAFLRSLAKELKKNYHIEVDVQNMPYTKITKVTPYPSDITTYDESFPSRKMDYYQLLAESVDHNYQFIFDETDVTISCTWQDGAHATSVGSMTLLAPLCVGLPQIGYLPLQQSPQDEEGKFFYEKHELYKLKRFLANDQRSREIITRLEKLGFGWDIVRLNDQIKIEFFMKLALTYQQDHMKSHQGTAYLIECYKTKIYAALSEKESKLLFPMLAAHIPVDDIVRLCIEYTDLPFTISSSPLPMRKIPARVIPPTRTFTMQNRPSMWSSATVDRLGELNRLSASSQSTNNAKDKEDKDWQTGRLPTNENDKEDEGWQYGLHS